MILVLLECFQVQCQRGQALRCQYQALAHGAGVEGTLRVACLRTAPPGRLAALAVRREAGQQ